VSREWDEKRFPGCVLWYDYSISVCGKRGGYGGSFLLCYFVNFKDSVVYGKGNIINFDYRVWVHWVGLEIAF